MSADGAVEQHVDRGLASALPCLVVVSCLTPLLGLALRSSASWVALGVVLLAAVGVCSFLLRGRGVLRAVGLGTMAVVAGTGCFGLVFSGLEALADSNQSGNDAASLISAIIPLALAGLAVVAIVLSLRAFPDHRLVLGAAWAVALATPFMLWAPVGALSDAAGNAGMDVVGLVTYPLAAFSVWTFLLAGSFVWTSASN